MNITLSVTIAFFSAISLYSCGESGKNISHNREILETPDSTVEIIDPIPRDNIHVAYRPPLELPEDLFPQGVNGYVVFSYRLRSSGEIQHVDVAQLIIDTDKETAVVNYVMPYGVTYTVADYPRNIQNYVAWLLDYARLIQFESSVQEQDTTLSAQLMVRF